MAWRLLFSRFLLVAILPLLFCMPLFAEVSPPPSSGYFPPSQPVYLYFNFGFGLPLNQNFAYGRFDNETVNLGNPNASFSTAIGAGLDWTITPKHHFMLDVYTLHAYPFRYGVAAALTDTGSFDILYNYYITTRWNVGIGFGFGRLFHNASGYNTPLYPLTTFSSQALIWSTILSSEYVIRRRFGLGFVLKIDSPIHASIDTNAWNYENKVSIGSPYEGMHFKPLATLTFNFRYIFARD